MSRRLAAAIRGEGIMLGCPPPSSAVPPRRRAEAKPKHIGESIIPKVPDAVQDCCILVAEPRAQYPWWAPCADY